jgi:hypothetical protein
MDQKTKTGLLAFAIVAGLACVVVAVALTAALVTTTSPAPAPKAPVAGPVAGDPWPECAAVREWLRTNLHDPASLEIVQRRGRDVEADGRVTVSLKYRATNDRGARQLQGRMFTVERGRVTFSREANWVD